MTDGGAKFLTAFGTDLSSRVRSRRIFCKPCLDWSERRFHVAGLVGTEICRRSLELGWVARQRDTRALRVTPAGQRGLADKFGVELWTAPDARAERAVALSA